MKLKLCMSLLVVWAPVVVGQNICTDCNLGTSGSNGVDFNGWQNFINGVLCRMRNGDGNPTGPDGDPANCPDTQNYGQCGIIDPNFDPTRGVELFDQLRDLRCVINRSECVSGSINIPGCPFTQARNLPMISPGPGVAASGRMLTAEELFPLAGTPDSGSDASSTSSKSSTVTEPNPTEAAFAPVPPSNRNLEEEQGHRQLELTVLNNWNQAYFLADQGVDGPPGDYYYCALSALSWARQVIDIIENAKCQCDYCGDDTRSENCHSVFSRFLHRGKEKLQNLESYVEELKLRNELNEYAYTRANYFNLDIINDKVEDLICPWRLDDGTLDPNRPILQGQGCDAVDNDCNCEIDECEEDNFQPRIFLPVKPHQVFKQRSDAREWLGNNVIYWDDCANNLAVTVADLQDSDCEDGDVEGIEDCTLSVTVRDTRCCTETDFMAGTCDATSFQTRNFVLQVKKADFEAILLRGFGCDGVDNDLDCLIDECDEDIVLPTVKLSYLPAEPFKDRESAFDFLETYLCVEDDCAVEFNIEITAEMDVDCEDNPHDPLLELCEFEVQVTDPRCEETANAVMKTFILDVKKSKPVLDLSVNCGFCDLHPQGEIFVIDDHDYGDHGLVDTKFFYEIGIPEGAEVGKLNVCVNVYSNELEVGGHIPMAFLSKTRKDPESVFQTQVYLSPSSCHHPEKHHYPAYPYYAAGYDDAGKDAGKEKKHKSSKKGEDESFYQFESLSGYQHGASTTCLAKEKHATTRFYEVEVVVTGEGFSDEVRTSCPVAVAPPSGGGSYKYGYDPNWRHLADVKDHVKNSAGGAEADTEVEFSSSGGSGYSPGANAGDASSQAEFTGFGPSKSQGSLQALFNQSEKTHCVATLCTEWDPTLDSDTCT